MRRLLLAIMLCILWVPSALAYDVLVLLSRNDPGQEEALRGFRSAGHFSERRLVVADFQKIDLARIVREERPQAVLAIGTAALEATRSIGPTPVVGIMSFALQLGSSNARAAGVGMLAHPGDFIRQFRRMGRRRVGVVYDPANSGWYLRQARQAAREAGVELVTREVTAPRDTIRQLFSLSGGVDALWMLPDVTVVTRETTEAWFRFAQGEKVPVVSFAAFHLGLGASLVVVPDRVGLGKQAGALVAALLKGGSGSRVVYPERTEVMTNPSVLKRLGLYVSE